MDTDEATNLVDGDDTAVDTVIEADDAGVDNEPEQFDENGEPIVPDDDEEIEFGDLKLKVPKDKAQEVRDGILRQQDYTRKTQEVADARKALEAREQQFNQSSNAEITALANVRAMDSQLAEYQRIDWSAWNDQAAQAASQGNPQEQARVNAAWMEYQQLEKARGQAAGQFLSLRQQRDLETKQTFAKRAQETTATLSKDIPDWSPELEAKLTTYGKKEFGFSDDEIADIKIDPRIAKVLHAAFKGSKDSQTNKNVQKIQKQQEVTPTAAVGRSSAPLPGVHDKLPVDEWMKREAARVARKKRA